MYRLSFLAFSGVRPNSSQRYILPLIAPPTPPQIEQDKAAVDAQFERAFELLEQLETDTKALKASEESRTQRLDAALAEMETVITTLKDSSRRREDDSRRIEDDLRGLRDLIPKALDAHKENTASQLKDLGTELKSLKTLVANRMGSAPGPVRPTPSAYGSGVGTSSPAVNGTPAASEPAASAPTTNATDAATSGTPSVAPASEPVRSYSPYGRMANGRASIPAWQMAAAKKSQEEQPSESQKDTSESGTVTEEVSSA